MRREMTLAKERLIVLLDGGAGRGDDDHFVAAGGNVVIDETLDVGVEGFGTNGPALQGRTSHMGN